MFSRRSARASRRIDVMNNPEWDDVSSVSSEDDLVDADRLRVSTRSDYSRLDHGQAMSFASMRQPTGCATSMNKGSNHESPAHSFQAIPLDAPNDAPDVQQSGRDDPKSYHSTLTEEAASLESRRPQAESTPRALPAWHPFWFRPGVLWSFCGLFLCQTAVLIFLVAYSRAHSGLTDANSRLAYVWRFGPVAFLTIVALLWSRTELQILRYTPWVILQQRGHAHSIAFDLDYTEMLPHIVFWSSLKHRHFLISVVFATAVLLKIQAVLSPAIFQLVTIESLSTTDVELLSSFNKSYAFDYDTGNAHGLAYSNAQAMQQFEWDFPFGVADNCAYQTYSLQKETRSRASADAPLSVNVEGLFMEGECRRLEKYTISNISLEESEDISSPPKATFSVELRFEDCEEPISFDSGVPYPMPVTWSLSNLADDLRNCSSLSRQHRQLLYLGVNYDWDLGGPEPLRVNHLTAAICSTRSYTNKVQILDDGVHPDVSLVGGRDTRTDVDISPWRLLSTAGNKLNTGGSSVSDAVGPVVWYYEQQNKDANASDASLYNTEILVNAFESMSKQFMPFLSHYVLRLDMDGQAEGTRIRQVQRLRANFGVCVAMSILSAACALLCLFAIYDSRKRVAYFHRDPATVLGSLIHLHGGGKDLYAITSTTTAAAATRDHDARKVAWSRGTFTPLILRTWFRTMFVVYLLLLIAWLGFTVRRSQQYDGLIFIDDSAYWPLLFQSLPSLAMLLVSLYANAADTVIRSLAILSSISAQARSSVELDVSLIDMLGLRALYYSIRYNIPMVTFSQILAAVCAFLPTISSVLLVPQFVPQTTTLIVQQRDWFVDQKVTDDNVEILSDHRETLANLNVMRKTFVNFTYPPGTYYDLVFPTLDMEIPEQAPGVSVKVTTSAAKLRPATCEQLSMDDGDFHIEKPWLDPDTDTPWDPMFKEEFACPNDIKANFTSFINLNEIGYREDEAYFGFASDSGLNPVAQYKQCSGDRMLINITFDRPSWVVQTYVWGVFEKSSLSFEHLSVVRCNYSWVNVMTDVNLQWSEGSMMIDHSNPPKEDESSMRPWTPAFNVPIFADYMVDRQVSSIANVFDGFEYPTDGVSMRFSAILEPYNSVKLEDLGDPDKDDQILEALHSSLGFVVAQLANIEQREDLSNTSNSTESDASREDMGPVRATLTDERLIRVVQNANITYALISILAIAAIINIWAIASCICSRNMRSSRRRRPWFLLDMENRGLAPQGFNSIAMMKALLDGSNVPRILPRDAQLVPAEDLHRHLAGRVFRLGWFLDRETDTRIFTIATLHDDRLVFLGYRVEDEKASAAGSH